MAAELASMVAGQRCLAAGIIAPVERGATLTAGITADIMAAADMADITDAAVITMAAGGTGAEVGMAVGATHIGASGGATHIGAGDIRMATIRDTLPIITTRMDRRIMGRAPIRMRIHILILARQDISASRTGMATRPKEIRRPIRRGNQGPT
jgi:hypothetical protein